jgi:hypothetical protein
LDMMMEIERLKKIRNAGESELEKAETRKVA